MPDAGGKFKGISLDRATFWPGHRDYVPPERPAPSTTTPRSIHMSNTTRIAFEAEITLTDDEIDGQGGLERAVQNEIGHTGAVLVRITRIYGIAHAAAERYTADLAQELGVQPPRKNMGTSFQ